MSMGCFSCFKFSSSNRHDEDPNFEADTNRALEISRKEVEDRIRRQKIEEDEQIEINKAKEESLKVAHEQEEEKRRLELEESKEKGKRKQVEDDQVDDKGQIEHSKDHVLEEYVNPSPSICNGCNSEIGDGIPLNAFDAVWHPHCFCCHYCRKPIAMQELSKKGKFHRLCHKENRHPNCSVCHKKIPVTGKGIKYSEHPFWLEKYCPSHDTDGTAKCCSCERLEPSGTNYVMLGDDRWLCLECMGSSVMDTYECHDLHVDIREFFEGLFFKVEKEFPVLLVEKQALNKAEEEEKIDYLHAVVTRGICLSEEQTVTSVKKGPKMGPNNKLIDMETESQTVSGCEVTAILILYGLPRLLTGYILAHEMMHAWLRLNGYKNLKLELEEGLCQLLGLRWLEFQTFASTDASAASSSSSRTPPAATTSKKCDDWSDFEKKLVEFCIHEIKEDDSPVYGDGFRQVYKISKQYNLIDTLKEIVSISKTTTIPDSKI
ncbi:hypothetical protein AALP_AA8G503600 [Arabis alpina]|uniref:LIM zinc-binding domain-containing protein n=1 Tax=Arabis alpina TaxID=50452 RepID=A0A087GEN8_ARAAL|nr:hypothetical protein AALP_AA8G503600 [Arabis alpina]